MHGDESIPRHSADDVVRMARAWIGTPYHHQASTRGVGADCLLTILCDSRRATIKVEGGTSAQHTAARVGANVPHGFRALVDGPVVSVWKDADFFSAVA